MIKLPLSRTAAPEPSPDWHPAIVRWFEGLRDGPEAEFLTPAGWGFAFYLGERESRNLALARPSAQTSALFVAAQSDLLTTEGARRRLRIELDRSPDYDFPGLSEWKRTHHG